MSILNRFIYYKIIYRPFISFGNEWILSNCVRNVSEIKQNATLKHHIFTRLYSNNSILSNKSSSELNIEKNIRLKLLNILHPSTKLDLIYSGSIVSIDVCFHLYILLLFL